MKNYSSLVRHAGNENLFRAIEMSVLSIFNGYPLHLHAEGLRGTGKTTIIRSARYILPPIRRIKGCRYNCDPAAPHCPEHAGRDLAELERLGVEFIPMPFLEVSHSAKIGTVVGSIDLARIVDPSSPSAALLPGTIPQAHRGIIFIDEINRLADTSPELADVFLEVMGTKPGRIQVEETGLPRVEMPVSVAVWAASNPDEEPGPLEDVRRQLADRFDLVVSMARPVSASAVRQILEASDTEAAGEGRSPGDYRELFGEASSRLGKARLPGALRDLLAAIYIDFNLESLRSVEALQLGAQMAAMLAGREEVTVQDLMAVAPMALHHRVDGPTLNKIMRTLGEHLNHESKGVAGVAAQPETSRETVAQPPGLPSQATAAEREGASPRPLEHLLSRVKDRLLGGARSTPDGCGSFPPAASTPAGTTGNNPLDFPGCAPPLAARPLVELPVQEMIRREEELGD